MNVILAFPSLTVVFCNLRTQLPCQRHLELLLLPVLVLLLSLR